jgi:thioredoxin reductase
MSSTFSRYTHWLHTCWPAGTVEKLPVCDEHGRSTVPGVRIVGDLTGIPLLKFSAETAARAVHEIADELAGSPQGRGGSREQTRNGEPKTLDLAIIGGGVAGISAAIEAKRAGLTFVVFEATQLFSTVANFPKAKPIYTYPTEMTPVGGLQFRADIKEALLDEMEAQRCSAGIEITTARIERLERTGEFLTMHHSDGTTTLARRVIIAIGRSGNFRKLECHGEDLPKVFNRLHDPKEFAGRNVLVVGGGDTALETAIALGACGAHVTLSYRKKEFSRPKPENIEKLRALEQDAANPVQIEKPTSERISTALTPAMQKTTPTGSVKLLLGSTVESITTETVTLRDADGQSVRLMNDVVFTMLGREAPLDFFRRSGIKIRGEWTAKTWLSFIVFALFCIFLYHWKSGDGSVIYRAFHERHWFPFNVPDGLAALSEAAHDPKTMLGTLASAAGCAELLLFTGLLRDHCPLRHPSDRAAEDSLRHRADAFAHGGASRAALSSAVSRAAVDGRKRVVRRGFWQMVRRPILSRWNGVRAPIGGRLASSSPGRFSSGTSSPIIQLRAGSCSRFCRPSC